MVWLPIVKDDAATVSKAAVEEHALICGEVVPVTETVAPTVSSDASVVFVLYPTETKMDEVLPLAVNRKPLIDPFPE
jgi:hypothetical protein